jgi:hypothetical protein
VTEPLEQRARQRLKGQFVPRRENVLVFTTVSTFTSYVKNVRYKIVRERNHAQLVAELKNTESDKDDLFDSATRIGNRPTLRS